MKLLFKQRIFSWFDSYDIFDENGNTVFSVEGKLGWGHRFEVHNNQGFAVGEIKEQVLTFLPKFEIYVNETLRGTIKKEFTFFKPAFDIDYNGWHIEGDFFEWDYKVYDRGGCLVATVTKELFNWSDTYSIDVEKPQDALDVLMLVLAIDAEKCSRD